MLVDTDLPGYGIPLSLIASIATASALLLMAIVGTVLKTRRRAVVSGPADMIDSIAKVVDASGQEGWVFLRGENWRVTSKTPRQRGQKVRVLARNGLILEVAPAGNEKKGE